MNGHDASSVMEQVLNSSNALGPLASTSGSSAIDSSEPQIYSSGKIGATPIRGSDSPAGTDSGYDEGSSGHGQPNGYGTAGSSNEQALFYPPQSRAGNSDRRHDYVANTSSSSSHLPPAQANEPSRPPGVPLTFASEGRQNSSFSTQAVQDSSHVGTAHTRNQTDNSGFTVKSGQRSRQIFGTPPVGIIGKHKPREIIRIHRDYSAGEICQFSSKYPPELEGRVRNILALIQEAMLKAKFLTDRCQPLSI